MSIYLVVLIVMILNGGILAGLAWLGKSSLMEKHRTRKDWPRKVPDDEHVRNRTINSIVSTAMIFGTCFALHDFLFIEVSQSFGAIIVQTILILALYDFGYYFLHRYAFHEWTVGRRWHGVHHRIRSPYVTDSLFIHPIETMLGLGLFFLCVLIVGPVSVYAFGVAFFVYSAWNLFIHSAFDLPFFPFKAMSSLVTHHDLHHRSMKAGYYASLTPICDFVFGTATEHKKRQVGAQ